MITVAKSTGATVANGALAFWYQGADGVLADVAEVSVQILDLAGNTVLAKTALDVGGVNHVGTGHYAAAWTPGAAAVGLFVLRWFYKVALTDDEQSFDLSLELVAVPYPAGPQYCSVASIRAEGLPSTGTGSKTDAEVQAAIVRASLYVNLFTGRTFGAARKTVRLNGSGGRALMLDEPIVALEEVNVEDPLGGLQLLDDTMRVFNRHLTEGLLAPDDRENPKLEFIHGNDLTGVNEYPQRGASFVFDLTWPRGRQNVHTTGLFGYTEPDGSFIGGTPALIQEATRMLVFRNLDKLSRRVGAGRGPVIQETTKDQTVIFAQPGAGGDTRSRAFTGDPEIDMILVAFVRPPYLGAA